MKTRVIALRERSYKKLVTCTGKLMALTGESVSIALLAEIAVSLGEQYITNFVPKTQADENLLRESRQAIRAKDYERLSNLVVNTIKPTNNFNF